MSLQQLDLIAPLATTLPNPPDGEVLTPDQWATLLAVAETVVPSVCASKATAGTSELALNESDYNALVRNLQDEVANPPDDQAIAEYLQESATGYTLFRQELHRTLAVYVREDARKRMAFLLNTLNTRLGSLIFNGSTVPFHQQSLDDRTAALQRWSEAYLPTLRQAHQALTQLVKSTWIKSSPTVRRALGFPRNPAHGTPGKGFDFDFLQIPPGSGPHVLETDVIIVGSGCGAGVVAKNLAEDGNRVVVVDKGYHYPPEHFPMTELHGTQLLFEGGALQPSDDGSITLTAGSTWGGGGTVNWSASLQTQGYVRKEWASKGLDFFTSEAYQACLDRVCDRMGVSTKHIEHNHGNRVLLEGARRLGYSARPVPQNTGGSKHFCGYCTLGCGSVEKQGPVVSWLPDAARAGAEFLDGYQVDHVVFEEGAGGKTAVGVAGTWTSRDKQSSRDVIVKAKRTVVSAGTLWSPLVLLNSGLKNPQIGQNLKLHPVTFVFGMWSKEIRPWEGGILTAVCDELQNLDGQGHGAKLECLVMLPAFALPLLPGCGLDFKKRALKFKQMNGFISLVRDKDSGRVYPDRSGVPRIAYTPSATDRAHCLEGAIALAKICYVTGAEEIYVTNGTKPYVRSQQETGQVNGKADHDLGINHPKFQRWLQEIRAAGLPTPGATFSSAHQMGTCRMGTNPSNSVVSPTGQVWGTRNLYVADASVFPSASGVNPMVTNMAISDWISRGLAKELRAGAK